MIKYEHSEANWRFNHVRLSDLGGSYADRGKSSRTGCGLTMAIKLLYGRQRKALRAACLAEVCELTRNWPDKRAILLVPEQTKMDMEQDYLRQSGQSGLMMAEVLSFRRLAWRLLGDVGKQPLQPVDRVGQSMLIHQVLKEHQASLHTFGFLADKPGFISQVAAVIGDLKRYGINGSQLLHLELEKADIGLQNKAGDLGTLLQHYDAVLAATGLGDAEDDLNRLADVLATLAGLTGDRWPWPWQRLAWLRHTDVWVSGFGELRDFTPQEDAVLAGLAALVENLTISVTADHIPADRQAVEVGPDPFLPGRRTAFRLRAAFPASNLIRISQELPGLAGQIEDCLLTDRQTFKQKPPDDFPPSAESFDDPSCALRLIQADGLDDELDWVAGEIRQLVQVDGFRYRDITLALCDLSGYAARLRAVCREYGIPVFLDQEKPLSGTPLLRFIMGLLDIDLTGWSRHALMSCLRSGMTTLTALEIDRLENEWLARGLFRFHRLFDDRLYQDHMPATERTDASEAADDPDSGTDLQGSQSASDSTEPILDLRDRALQPLRRFLSGDSVRKAAPARDKCLALRRFLIEYGLEQRILAVRDDLVAEGEMDAAVSLIQSWNELDRLLDQMEHLAGDTSYTLQTFRDVLAAGMDSAASSIIPTAIDQVGVGDLRRAMLRQPQVLFIVGASAANLPPPPPPEGLLKDQDRQALSRMLDRQLPSVVRDQLYADAFVMYTLLTLPTARLYLTAPDAALSPGFRWLAAQMPESFHILPQTSDWRDVRLNAVKPARNRLQSLGCEWPMVPATEKPGWLALIELLSEKQMILPTAVHRAMPADLACLPDQLVSGQPPADSQLAADLTRDLYGQPAVLSVSRLERYTLCPFLHLSEQLLHLQERPVWAPQATETGILLHGIMELAIGRLRQDLRQIDPADTGALTALWQTWLQSDLEQPVRAWMIEIIQRDGLVRFLDHGLQASVGRRIRKMAASSIQAVLHHYQDQGADADRPYLPVILEWIFGQTGQQLDGQRVNDQRSASKDLALPVPEGQPIHLRGKIDRIDERTTPDGRQFRIIDYKSGNKHVDYEDLYQGLALQMPIYLAAYSQANPGLQPADAAYFHLDHPVASLAAGEMADPSAIRARLLKAQDLRGMKLTPEELERVCAHALNEASRIAASMLQGTFPAFPCKKPGRQPACVTCAFQALCGFDDRFNPYRRPEPLRCRKNPAGKTLSKKDELMLRLREQAGSQPD